MQRFVTDTIQQSLAILDLYLYHYKDYLEDHLNVHYHRVTSKRVGRWTMLIPFFNRDLCL